MPPPTPLHPREAGARRPRPALRRRTAALILTLGVVVLVTGVLWLAASVWSARQLRQWGFDANTVLAPGIGLAVVGAGLLVWGRLGRRPR